MRRSESRFGIGTSGRVCEIPMLFIGIAADRAFPTAVADSQLSYGNGNSDPDFTVTKSPPKLAPVTPLHGNKLFSRVPKAELARLTEVTRELRVPPGEFIFKEGDSGDAVYVIKEGFVQISTALEAGERSILSRFGPGEIFGELAALDDAARSASASAETDAVLYRIPRE